MADFKAALDAFRERLDGAGLRKYSDSLLAMVRPSVRLVVDAASVNDRSTRLGGVPDLPASTTWPRNGQGPLSFIAQVDLADVAQFDVQGLLPRTGLLSFFYDAVRQQAWGFDPADHGSAAVIYTPKSVATDRLEPPADLSSEGVFNAVELRPQNELTLPPWESYDVETLGMTQEEGFAYAEVLYPEDDEDDVIHRLLGHPQPIQGDMQVECQLVTNGLYCGNSTGYEDPRAVGLRSGAAEWRLLLQVDSQDEAGMMWGDVGRLYYWMNESDLRARAWESSWLILQCG